MARVVVLEGPGPGEGLVEALGPERAAAVGALLVARARAWAQGAFGAEAVECVADRSFGAAFAPGPVGSAGGGGGGGPVVAIVPELPVWPAELASAVLSDLENGCTLSLAPMFDRGLYLLALADPPGAAGALGALDLAGPAGMTELIGLAQREGWQVGLLRAERGLRRARDVRALLADPLTDPELRALLA